MRKDKRKAPSKLHFHDSFYFDYLLLNIKRKKHSVVGKGTKLLPTFYISNVEYFLFTPCNNGSSYLLISHRITT